ncbi:MAG: hypothetical protein EBR79_03565, partial [Proteobacteria bacterium]|nr:hypothetical protein [Pseudomonadota bacterium]NBX86608.1 hypothetical protein [Pseudomonadota bacterium]
MMHKHPYGRTTGFGWLAWCVGVAILLTGQVVIQAVAQEQFFTQSGGRGLQNAKTNARLTKAETDIGGLQADVARIKPHAFAELGACGDTAEKLRWDGNNWICEKETDPTVQSFAKQALPSCGNGTILSAQGGDFACVPASFVSDEVDPTVQAWAKGALPTCGSGEVLSASGGGFSCVADKQGLPNESDPFVYDFARKGVATIPNCGLDDVLVMLSGRLVCRNFQALKSESDPYVQDFARNDVSGSTPLAACAAGEVLRAVTVNGKVQLQCASGAGSLTETLGLNDLNDVTTAGQTSGTFLGFNGSTWRPLVPVDSTVQAWARTGLTACGAGQVLSYNGSSLVCVADVGAGVTPTLAGLSDVNVSGVSNGQFLQYNSGSSRWVPGTVQAFALATLPTCSAGQVLSGNGTSLSCVSDSGASGSNLNVASISVTTNAQVDGALTAATAGFGSVAMSGNLTGAALISTSQGGVVSASRVHAGVVSATQFIGDGSQLTGVAAGSAAWSALTGIPAQVAAVSNSGAINLSTLTANVVSGTYVQGRYASFTDVLAGSGRFTGT